MKAVVAFDNKAILQNNRPIPQLRSEFVRIKTAAVALNPTDWKHLNRQLVANGCLLGCDFAGTVDEVGPGVVRKWAKGDRVAGVSHGGNMVEPEDGAFADYIVAKGDILVRLPDSLSFEDAATFPLGAATVMQGLYQKGLKMNLPYDPVKQKTFVLIFGGSTATGALGIQYAKSGYQVIATCSPRNFEYLEALGVDHLFDSRDDKVGVKIRAFTQNDLKLAWDLISEERSSEICAQALSSDCTGCRYASFLDNKSPRDDVVSVGTNMYTVWGESFETGCLEYPASKEDFEWAKKFMFLTEELLGENKLKTHKATIKEGGLEAVLRGLDDLRNNRVSGEKLVYTVSETPQGESL